MNNCYFWKDGNVLVTEQVLAEEAIRYNYTDLLCVDACRTDPESRYGVFKNAPQRGWKHVPLENFPKEFRMHLLLLGVS